MLRTSVIRPPGSWRNPDSHWRTVLSHPWYRRLIHVRHDLDLALSEFFSERRMVGLALPLTTGSISSPMGIASDSLPVEIDLCGVRTYLADSMQFMLEFGCRLHPEGVFYVMTCFRGEPADATHLPQFIHAEVELAGGLADIIDLGSALIRFLAERMLARRSDIITELAGGTNHIERLLAQTAPPCIRLDEAVKQLREDARFVAVHPLGYKTLTRAGEAEIQRLVAPDGLLWITHFNSQSVPFYQATECGTTLALNGDLILGGRETLGAGERQTTAQGVERAMVYQGVENDAYRWYIEMKREFPLRTSGFGLGTERFLLWLLQHDDIRDMTLLHRQNGENRFP